MQTRIAAIAFSILITHVSHALTVWAVEGPENGPRLLYCYTKTEDGLLRRKTTITIEKGKTPIAADLSPNGKIVILRSRLYDGRVKADIIRDDGKQISINCRQLGVEFEQNLDLAVFTWNDASQSFFVSPGLDGKGGRVISMRWENQTVQISRPFPVWRAVWTSRNELLTVSGKVDGHNNLKAQSRSWRRYRLVNGDVQIVALGRSPDKNLLNLSARYVKESLSISGGDKTEHTSRTNLFFSGELLSSKFNQLWSRRFKQLNQKETNGWTIVPEYVENVVMDANRVLLRVKGYEEEYAVCTRSDLGKMFFISTFTGNRDRAPMARTGRTWNKLDGYLAMFNLKSKRLSRKRLPSQLLRSLKGKRILAFSADKL